MTDCIVCYETISDETGVVRLKCKHEYCPPCFAKHMRVANKCAYCRDTITEPPKQRTEEGDQDTGGGDIEGDVVWEPVNEMEVYRMLMLYFMPTPAELTQPHDGWLERTSNASISSLHDIFRGINNGL
jgi:hypothetical protein